MEPKQFDKLVNHRLESCKKVLCSKEEEYSSEEDRLHNFKVAADFLGTTPEKALMGMWVKHLVSVLDLINNPDTVTQHLLKEKFGDTINYSLLAEACLTEKMVIKVNQADTGRHIINELDSYNIAER